MFANGNAGMQQVLVDLADVIIRQTVLDQIHGISSLASFPFADGEMVYMGRVHMGRVRMGVLHID